MKFKLLFSVAVAIATTLFIVSCDDDLDSIGSGIQPGIDDIDMKADQVLLTAETVKLSNAVYLRTDRALLGTLDDPILGRTQSEFMAEFFSANGKFELGHDGKASVDSVFFTMTYLNSDITGDSLSTMGITLYELTKELEPNFYTDIKVSDYTDKKKILGQRFFTHAELNTYNARNNNNENVQIGKTLWIEMNKSFGEKIYDAWVEDKSVLANSENFKKLFKGMYITSDFNNKTLIEVLDANSLIKIGINYSYKTKKVKEPTVDSTVVRAMTLQVGGSMLQLNSVADTPNDGILTKYAKNDPAARTYIKSPAGVVTKISIPLEEIRKKAIEKTGTDKYTINSSVFKLTGMTEEEKKMTFTKKHDKLLFINKDSLENFFVKTKTIDGVGSLLMWRGGQRDQRTGALIESTFTNTYHFINPRTGGTSNNISNLINHYIEKEKDKGEKDKTKVLEYYVMPVDVIEDQSTRESYVRHALTPSANIFRTDEKNLTMSLMFSKYSEIE